MPTTPLPDGGVQVGYHLWRTRPRLEPGCAVPGAVRSAAGELMVHGMRDRHDRNAHRNRKFVDLYGSFSVKWFFGLLRFLVWSGKAVPRPVACDQVRGARGKVSRDRNASKAWRLAAYRRLCFRSDPCSSQGQALTPEHAEG